MSVRGVRGATTVAQNQREDILAATVELLRMILQANPDLHTVDIASAWFTLTDDLDAAYPAQAARDLGWVYVPLMCAREIAVPGSLPRCIRVMLHWNTDQPQDTIHHVYLRDAVSLRPEFVR